MRLPTKEALKRSSVIAEISLISALVIAFLVFLTDGTKQPFPHLMYIPIIFSALLGNWYLSTGVALLCGLLVSHWIMPLSVTDQIPQELYPSLFRMGNFLLISLWTKAVYEHQKKKIERLATERAAMYKIQQDSLSALIDLAESRDSEVTGQHLIRLKEYCRILMTEMDLSEEYKAMLADTIAFHDIGKVSVRDSILIKPGPLDDSEWDQMKKHTVTGAKILERLEDTFDGSPNSEVKEFLHMAREVALYHHERIDGTGYPEKLKGGEIPLSARITAICDVYDALRSHRPYKEALSHEEAMQLIVEGKGGHFDPELVDLFLEKELAFKNIFDHYFPDMDSNI